MSEDPCVTAQPVAHMTMTSKIAQAFKEMVTERDNKTHSPWKWSLIISVASVIAHDGYLLSHGVQVGVRDFAFALAALLTGAGIGTNQGRDQ